MGMDEKHWISGGLAVFKRVYTFSRVWWDPKKTTTNYYRSLSDLSLTAVRGSPSTRFASPPLRSQILFGENLEYHYVLTRNRYKFYVAFAVLSKQRNFFISFKSDPTTTLKTKVKFNCQFCDHWNFQIWRHHATAAKFWTCTIRSRTEKIEEITNQKG